MSRLTRRIATRDKGAAPATLRSAISGAALLSAITGQPLTSAKVS